MANEQNIRKVITMIENEANFFNMARWDCTDDLDPKYPENVCGTPSCIGGWAESIIRYEEKIGPRQGDEEFLPERQVAEWLGLTESEGERLFYPYSHNWSTITREQAINHLEHIIETGEVDWSVFIPTVEDHTHGE